MPVVRPIAPQEARCAIGVAAPALGAVNAHSIKRDCFLWGAKRLGHGAGKSCRDRTSWGATQQPNPAQVARAGISEATTAFDLRWPARSTMPVSRSWADRLVAALLDRPSGKGSPTLGNARARSDLPPQALRERTLQVCMSGRSSPIRSRSRQIIGRVESHAWPKP